MAVKFTGTDFNGAAANADDDTWVTRAGEIVSHDGGFAFHFFAFSGNEYIIEGSLIASGSSDGVTSLTGSFGHQVYIRPSGTIWGNSDGIALNGDGHRVVNEGSVIGTGNAGIQIFGSGARIENLGSVWGGAAGIDVRGSGTHTVFNSGTVSGVFGVSLAGDAGSTTHFINTGTVSSTSQFGKAIIGGASSDTVVNTGILNGDIDLGAGNDTLILPQSNPGGLLHFDGGADSDTIDLSGFGFGVWVDFSYAGVTVWTQDDNDASGGTPGIWRTLADTINVENAVGTVGLDLLRGNDEDNTFGFVGSPHIAGVDRIIGQGGSDTADFSRFDFAVWVSLSFSGIEAWTQDDGDALTQSPGIWRTIADLETIENIVGTKGVDYLQGDALDNVIGYVGDVAFTGIEEIDGLGGNDTVDFSRFDSAVWVSLSFVGAEAWTQDDSNAYNTSPGQWREIANLTDIENLTGTRHDDELKGDDSANVIFGLAGDDILTGRGDNDTFVFANSSAFQGFGYVRLADFSANDAEKIDLSQVEGIIDFADLLSNHLVDNGGVAQIADGGGLSIDLIGWTVAEVGDALAISEDDFIF